MKTIRRTKMEDRTNNKIEKTAKIYYWDEELYLRKIDTTHVSISYEPDGQGVIYHVGQLDHREYYEDLCKWLRDEFDIDNQAYFETKRCDGCGSILFDGKCKSGLCKND